MKNILFFLFSFALFFSFSQEVTEPYNIKSIVFTGSSSGHLFPIVSLGESMSLCFDDLDASQRDYYYTITHCDYSWQPSPLLKSEYLKGMDDLKLSTYSNSYNTIESYTHYCLSLPNSDTEITLSGNYLLSILSSDGEVVFTRRFIVYTPSVSVAMEVKRSKDVKTIETHQSLEFSIRPLGFSFDNPSQSVSVSILQNYNWNTELRGIKPQYTLGGQLFYKQPELCFEAGNEYLYFDNKDIRGGGFSVYKNVRDESGAYQSILYQNTDRSEEPYTYNPDINGGFVISNTVGDASTESEYSNVLFSLSSQSILPSDKVFVYGAFSQNKLSPAYRLSFNPESQTYQCSIYLKQGFYNYKFAIVRDGKALFNSIDGNFYQTENTYTVIVYYKPFGATYHRVIGVSSIDSTKLTL